MHLKYFFFQQKFHFLQILFFIFSKILSKFILFYFILIKFKIFFFPKFFCNEQCSFNDSGTVLSQTGSKTG